MAGHTSARSHARLAAAGIALAAVVLVAGCGDADEPDSAATSTAAVTETATESPSTATETPEPTETSALPPLPEEATENTPEGAEAFIRYYFDVVNLATTTPDASFIPPLSADECVACTNLQGIAEELQEEGQRATDDAFAVSDIALVEEQGESTLLFTLTLETAPVDVVGPDGAVAYTLESDTSGRIVGVRWEDNAWVLLDAEVA